MISYTFMILLTIFMVLYAMSIFAVTTHDNPYKGYITCLLDCISVAFNYKFHHVYTIRVVDPSELAAVPGGPGSSTTALRICSE